MYTITLHRSEGFIMWGTYAYSTNGCGTKTLSGGTTPEEAKAVCQKHFATNDGKGPLTWQQVSASRWEAQPPESWCATTGTKNLFGSNHGKGRANARLFPPIFFAITYPLLTTPLLLILFLWLNHISHF